MQLCTSNIGVSASSNSNSMQSIMGTLNIKLPMTHSVYRRPVQTPIPMRTTYQSQWSAQISLTLPMCALEPLIVGSPSRLEQRPSREGAAPTIGEFLQHQATNRYCRQATQSRGTANCEYIIGKNGLIVQLAPIDGSVQVLVPQVLWECLLYHSHHLVMVGHPGQN